MIPPYRSNQKAQRNAATLDHKLGLGHCVWDYLPASSKYAQPEYVADRMAQKVQLDGDLSVERLVIARIPHENLTVPGHQSSVLTCGPSGPCRWGNGGGRIARGGGHCGRRLLARLRYALTPSCPLTLCRARDGAGAATVRHGSLDADVRPAPALPARIIPAALSGTLNFVIRNGELDARNPA